MTTLLLALGLLASIGRQDIAPRASATLRFHHLHYAVADPAAAMRRVAQASGGTALLVPALGPGVRVGREYVLFERITEAQSNGTDMAQVEASYRSTAMWLRRRGILLTEDATGGPRLAAHVGRERLDHVGFAALDFDGAIRALEQAGAAPLRRSADAALFKVPDGLRIEIVRDTDGPDAYWCPMHPDVRAAVGGLCPICGMALVAIPAPRVGEFRMDVEWVLAPRTAGAGGLRLTLRDPDTGVPVRSLRRVHERLLHLFLIGRDLEYFAHLHPEAAGDGTFEVQAEIPPGSYMLIADFLPAEGVSQMLQRVVVTPGFEGPLFQSPPALAETANECTVDGVRVSLEGRDVAAGKYATFRFSFADAATGAPLSDMELFLGAPAHLLLASTDLVDVVHAHPELDLPPITFEPLLPRAGLYKLWVQFQRKGRVSTAPFVVAVK